MKPFSQIVFSILVLGSALILVGGCVKEELKPVSCVGDRLEAYDMVPFGDQDLDCNFYLEQFMLDGEEYFQRANQCADIFFAPVDCEGKSIWLSPDTTLCDRFLTDATYIGIVGIRL